MDMEKMKGVLADKAFVTELLAQDEPEQVQLMLEEKGISVSIGKIEQIADLITKMQNGELTDEELDAIQSGVLTEEQLETVAGGMGLVAAIILIAISLFGAAAAMGTAMVLSSARKRW